MSRPQIKGYCPGALQPMQSGDGLVVRIRPFAGRLSQAQGVGIAALSKEFGNGILDLTARANLQLRGVGSSDHQALIDALRKLDLVDTSAEVEQRRNVIVTPFWVQDDETQRLSDGLTKALCHLDAPALPHKFGFAIDTGDVPVLQDTSADIRLERDMTGSLLLIAAGCDMGKPIRSGDAIEEALALARWFMAHRTDETRMAKLLERIPSPHGFTTPRQHQTATAVPGRLNIGTLCGFAFGQIDVAVLDRLAALAPLRMTPWRMLLSETTEPLPDFDTVITDPSDPLLGITACTGAPGCAQALGDTRKLARHLAPHRKTRHRLHISGCTKGCAHPKPAKTTITATPLGYDLIRNGCAADTPIQTGLTPAALIETL